MSNPQHTHQHLRLITPAFPPKPAPFTAASGEDPIFAAIANHKTAMVWQRQAIKLAGDDDEAVEAAVDESGADAAAWAIPETKPTTIAGCIAVLTYAADFRDGDPRIQPNEWPDDDDRGLDWHATLHRTVAEALTGFGGRES